MIAPVSHIVVGVADMAPVRQLWQTHFGLEVVASAQGADADLERLLGLPAGGVAEQLLLRTPGQAHGWLHFIRFSQPGSPLREGAATTALCPKNIDINCEDMPARVKQLEAAGYVFRSAISEYQIDGMTVREVQMSAHDAINVVLIEVPDWTMQLTAERFGGVTSFVVTVPDTEAEAAFYQRVFGHELLLHHRITGPEIEAVVGLPPGAALDMRLTGAADELLGRMELVSYEGIAGRNLFAAARAPATGSLAARFRVDDLDAFMAGANAGDMTVSDDLTLLFGGCRLAQFQSPAGFSVEAYELTAKPKSD